MKTTIQFIATAILLLMATASIDAQTTRYVDLAGSDSGGCSNPANPCATINYAIDQAGTGDIIDIAAGAYTEIISTDKSITLQGAGQSQPGGTIIQAHPTPGVSDDIVIAAIQNDFTVSDLVVRNGRWGIYSIQGNLTFTDVTITNNINNSGNIAGAVLYESSATLNGVIFENNLTSGQVGALNVGTVASNTVSLTDVLFTGNQAGEHIGAMVISGGGAVTLEDVTFYQNTAGENGGALYLNLTDNVSLNNVVFDNNEAGASGGAIYSNNSTATFTDVQFIENKAQDEGGAVFTEGNSNLYFANTVFLHNEAVWSGGGFIQLGNSLATMVNTLFFGNITTIDLSGGGGIANINSELTLINTTITGNETAGIGGGLYSTNNSITTLLNTSVWSNTASIGGNEITTHATATTTGVHSLYSDGPDDIFGDFTCSNCLTDDPGFTNPGSGDFTLSAGSPAINAGDPGTDLSVFPGGPSNPVDLNGNTRVQDGIIDIGAYEFGSLSTGGFQSMENITLYPNPVNDLLHIESEHPIDGVTIYDLSGKRVLSSSPLWGDRGGLIDLSELTSGVYVLKISAGGRQSGYRVVKR